MFCQISLDERARHLKKRGHALVVILSERKGVLPLYKFAPQAMTSRNMSPAA